MSQQIAPDKLTYLENEKITLEFLKQHYQKHYDKKEVERLAFRNSSTVSSYMKQAKAMFLEAERQSIWCQPITLYYAMMNLWKVWLLTKDPFYPQQTSHLKHGISTKKKKRQPFSLQTDEIRIQREGLVPTLLYLLKREELIGETYKIEQLISMIPEMQASYLLVKKVKTLWSIADHGEFYRLNEPLSDEWKERLTTLLPIDWIEQESLTFLKNEQITPQILYSLQESDPYLFIRKDRILPIPEAITLFMLMFGFSMLCRYDPPLWQEVVSNEWMKESIWVTELIQIIPNKFPRLIQNYLFRESNAKDH